MELGSHNLRRGPRLGPPDSAATASLVSRAAAQEGMDKGVPG
jgi:hypothetical protein